MVQLASGLATISPADVNLYHTTDALLSNLPLLIFHGASTTTNATLSSSRIQVHIFSAAGFTSYPRLTVSPNSPLYAVVDELPREWQGDEVCRGLAFGLMKYFEEMPEVVKSALIVQAAHSRGRRPGSATPLFGKEHAAALASGLVKVENVAEVIADVTAGIQTQVVSCVDVDLVLPPGSIVPLEDVLNEDEDEDEDEESADPSLLQYGVYAPLVKLFGDTAFLPTLKLRRAPSRPSSMNRSKSFLKNQKLSLRREMGEFVDTEERYVIKVHELVNTIADEFRARAKKRGFGSASPSEQDLQKLFPPSLDKILQVNKGFLADIQKIMDETEEEAMQDLEIDQVEFLKSRFGGTGRFKDLTGAASFAAVLLEWFPRFADCYQDYIRASQEFPQLISTFVRQQSSFSQRVQQTGEQKLRSSIIEPVQRLPRYSLFIDNIVNYLPIAHPALQSLLKARDIITSICSLDSPDADNSKTVRRLKTMVDKWPAGLFPRGRLISAVDVVELPPPYHASPNVTGSTTGMLLLFADTVVICRKNRDSTISARGLMVEVDKPTAAIMMAPVTAAAGGQRHVQELYFVGHHQVCDTRFTESQDGRVTWMTTAAALDREPTSAPSKRAFLLQGTHEGKASKWTEEVTKARVEDRFAEKERESDMWSLRSVKSKEAGLNIYAAVFAEGIDTLIEGRKQPAPIRIVVDHERGTKGAPVGHYGVEAVINVTITQGESGLPYYLRFDGLGERSYNDFADDATFMSVFAKRVDALLQNHYSSKNPALTSSFILSHINILNSLTLLLESGKAKPRPASPVKIISSFLSGGGSSSSSDLHKHRRTPTLGSISSLATPSLSRSNSKKDLDSAVPSTNSSFKSTSDEATVINPLVRLEETFTGYVAALQARKGNVVGKVLRNRASADELSVNAIYNTFIENPFDTRASSEVTVDVLFSAFEKFTRMAWTDQMGPVISIQTLQALQDKAARLFPGDFAEYIRLIFGDMAPQNRRAFVAIIKLLADLLAGCGNDGDRGALTAAFTELLVGNNDPHSYINLLDRLVEDCDRIFEDLGVGASNGRITPVFGSFNSAIRSQGSFNAGSLTSNTSLRKRFGFDTLLRQNSKREDENKPSMWRTLSKTGRSPAAGEQINGSIKGLRHRSKTIDMDSRLGTPKRPGSRDRPTVLGAFDRPSSSHVLSNLGTIGQSPSPPPPPSTSVTERTLRGKRRSSLSDLKGLMAAATLESTPAPLSPKRPNQLLQPAAEITSPRTPSPVKIPVSRARAYTISPTQKENSRPGHNVLSTLPERPSTSSTTHALKDPWSPPPPRSRPRHRPSASVSHIPMLRPAAPVFGAPTPFGSKLPPIPASKAPGLTSIPIPIPNAVPGHSHRSSVSRSPPPSPSKLRLQSPLKLRGRPHSDSRGIDAEIGLQAELVRIGEEMARLSAGSPSRSGANRDGGAAAAAAAAAEVRALAARVAELDRRIPELVRGADERHDGARRELERSVVVAEQRAKGLDQLYREASAENELLYERFNGELGRIVRALRGKGREEKEELVRRVKEAGEEGAGLRRENAMLRREVVGLRALVQGMEVEGEK